MADPQEAVSVRLYEILERVGLSEEMRLLHRHRVIGEMIQTVSNNLWPARSDELYIFGSLSEGSTVRGIGSDVDMVCCFSKQPVVTDVRETEVPESLLMVQDYHNHPGYVKVQRVLYEIPLTENETDEDGRYGPDVYGRMCFKHYIEPGKGVHGPAIDFSDKEFTNESIDLVPALKCVSVPNSVKLWLRRTRHYGWPPRRCMLKMETLPYLLVGVGHPYSVEEALEWRISSSLHERELMFSLNPTQHKCYGTMKMIKKNVIEPAVGEESISSYHLKTCLFWAIEKTPEDIWRPDQLLHCLNRCFWFLLYFVLTRNCPNYFRPDANLFEREVFLRLHDRLSSAINVIVQTFPDAIRRIRCADVGRNFLNSTLSISRLVLNGILVQRQIHFVDITVALNCLDTALVQFSYHCVTEQERVTKLYQLLHTWSHVRRITEHTEEQTDYARQLMLPILHFRLATCLAAQGFDVKNGPMSQYLLQLCILHLTQSSTRDLMGARLMYVTVLYKLGLYHQCEIILRQIDRNLQPHVISQCACTFGRVVPIHAVLHWITLKRLSIGSMLISTIVTCVRFLPSESTLVPEPLQYELNRSRDNLNIPSTNDMCHNIYNWALVDGKVYFHIMKYLVYSQEEKESCINDLISVINNDPTLKHKDTALNVLGWMYAQEHRHDDALQCWRKSLEIQPCHNAAFRHMRKHFGHGRVVVAKDEPDLYPKDISYDVLGLIYVKEHRYGDAFRCWNKSLELQEHNNTASRHVRELLSSFLNFATTFTKRLRDKERRKRNAEEGKDRKEAKRRKK